MHENGLEPITGASVFNADLGKLVHLLFGEEPILFAAPIDGSKSGGSVRPYERIIKGVAIRCDDVAPSGTSLLVQLELAGSLKSQTYALAAGQTGAYVAVTGDGNGGANPFTGEAGDTYAGPGVLVAANAVLKVQITTAANALNVTVTPIWRLRKL